MTSTMIFAVLCVMGVMFVVRFFIALCQEKAPNTCRVERISHFVATSNGTAQVREQSPTACRIDSGDRRPSRMPAQRRAA